MSAKLFRFDFVFLCYEGIFVYATSLEEALFRQRHHSSANDDCATDSGVILKPRRLAGGVTELDYRSAPAGTTEEKKLLRTELIVLNSRFETGYQEVEIND